MKSSGTTIGQTLLRLRARLGANGPAQKFADDEPPLRSELFSAAQIEQHGKTLADSHKLRHGRPRDRLLKRLAENEGILLGVRNLLTEAIKTRPPNHAGRGMVARQLLFYRRTDSHCQATFAKGLQPGVASFA